MTVTFDEITQGIKLVCPVCGRENTSKNFSYQSLTNKYISINAKIVCSCSANTEVLFRADEVKILKAREQ